MTVVMTAETNKTTVRDDTGTALEFYWVP